MPIVFSHKDPNSQQRDPTPNLVANSFYRIAHRLARYLDELKKLTGESAIFSIGQHWMKYGNL